MNLRDKLSEWRIGNYLRELSIVIIGVAVTLYASSVISDIKEEKDLQLQLDAVYAELEENVKRLDEAILYHDMHNKLRDYLYTIIKDEKTYSKDSVKKYDYVLMHTYDFIYKKSAYDMFVNSGAMKYLTDRNQLLNITESYAKLEEIKKANDEYMSLKINMYSNTYKMDRKYIFGKTYDITDPQRNVEFNFHALNSGLDTAFRKIKKETEEVIAERK